MPHSGRTEGDAVSRTYSFEKNSFQHETMGAKAELYKLSNDNYIDIDIKNPN